MKKLLLLIWLFCISSISIGTCFIESVFCYFSDTVTSSVSAKLSAASIEISRFTIEALLDDNGFIIGTPAECKISVKNTSEAPLVGDIKINTAFLGELEEEGALWFYHGIYSDEEVRDNVVDGGSNAIFSEPTIVNLQETSYGKSAEGISVTFAEDIELLPQSSFDIVLKILFLPLQNESIYGLKSVYFEAEANFSLLNPLGGWQTTAKSSLEYFVISDIVSPAIADKGLKKEYFIGEASGLKLLDFVYAFDAEDGYITDKIVAYSQPKFDPNKAGEYTITYTVYDSAGNAAEPLIIKIVILNSV